MALDMKLRLQGNSLRLRLTRSEVQLLRATGVVEEAVGFNVERPLIYRLEASSDEGQVSAAFRNGVIAVSVAPEAVALWAGSDEVGIYARSGGVTISIEKDFRCLTRPLDDSERDAYPNPLDECGVVMGSEP